LISEAVEPQGSKGEIAGSVRGVSWEVSSGEEKVRGRREERRIAIGNIILR